MPLTPSRTSQPSEPTFEIPPGRPGRLLLNRLKRLHGLREGPRHSRETFYLDTFDGRLFARSRVLWISEGTLRLEDLDRPRGHGLAGVAGVPVFADGLPPGDLRDELRALTGNRALRKLFSVRSEVRTWSARNDDQKTVLRVTLTDDVVSDGQRTARLVPCVAVRQVRGYPKIFRQVCQWWETQGVELRTGTLYRRAVAALELDPRAAAAVSGFSLAASMSAADAIRALLGVQYRVVRINEEGILDDTDVEFLHDFRVAVRRARSFLGLLGDVFTPKRAARLRKSLSWLGKSTNALRDLDVYLEQRAAYRGMLTGSLAEDLTPLFEFAARERQAACREFTGVMRSTAYRDALEGWRECVEDEAVLGVGPRGAEPIPRLVGARVAKKCRAVLRRGYQLEEGAEAAAFHSLRIECKQLRYLVEILAVLTPEVKGVVQRLKKLQDALGTIQDLTVHEDRTQEFARALAAAGDGRALAAADVLASRMRVERDLACARVPELFARFSRSLRETEPPYGILLPWLRRD